MNIKFNKDGPVTFGALGGTYPQMNARAGDFSVVSGIVRNGVLGPAVGDIVRPDNAASVKITMDDTGATYVADSGVLGDPVHRFGPALNEYHKTVPLTNHIAARWVVQKYVGFDAPVVDLTIENCWAYEPGPQNFKYDVEVTIAGKVVYSGPALTHFHHGRWRMVFNDYGVIADYPWLGEKAIPLYGPELPNEQVLKECAVAMLNTGPMKIGAATAYMPMTGAHNDIGILPAWQWAHIMSHDSRARACTLATADGAGSFSMHYRDKVTDLPVALKDHPRMTIAGHASDAGADAFPWVDTGTDAAPKNQTPYTQDIPHHPSLAFYPYLLTGDYYYLEELQFLANYCAFASNPGYRGAEQGLVQSEQLRGQAWALRTIGQAAYITPDAHPLKAEFKRIMDCNLDWYNATYPQNPKANKIGIIENGYAIDDEGQTATKPWMLNFFVASLGYNLGLGFDKAAPILDWVAAFPVGCMTAPGMCWIVGAPYVLKVRDTPQSPVYDTVAECFNKEYGPALLALPCAGSVMASAWGATSGSPGTIKGDMGGISNGNMGYPSNMQGALKYAVDRRIPGSELAWDRFMSRTVKPDYSTGGQFNLMPETYQAKPVPPVVDAIDTREWDQIAKEGDTVTVLADTTVRYGANGLYVERVCSGPVVASNAFFGIDPAPHVPKILQQLIPQPPEGNIVTYTVLVALTTGTIQLPAGSEAAPTSTIVEILDADKSTVLATSGVAPYSLPGVTAGDRFVRLTDYDSKGAAMGAPVLVAFTITEEVDVPPVDTTPVTATVTTGATITYTKD